MNAPTYHAVDGLDIAVEGPVLRLAINAPTRRNVLNDTSIGALIDAVETATTDESLRAVMITGTGKDFCSGFDIVVRNSRDADNRPRTGSIQRRLPTQANRLIPLLLAIQLPVICVVRGWAVGIGAQIALAADFTVAATDAVFWYPFLRRGFTPDSGSTWLLPRAVGIARARELLILDRKLSGAEAADWGIAHRAVEPDQVAQVADELLARLTTGPTVAIGLTKGLLNLGAEQDLRRQLVDEAFAMELSSRSPDFREGMKAFLERRSPSFDGR